jgi:uncharacterized protein (TIGR02646 family)
MLNMRRIDRARLTPTLLAYLRRRQSRLDASVAAGNGNVQRDWKQARATRAMQQVMAALRGMCGPRERCMYCVDSHAADIEHFRPKSRYPRFTFQWSNLLICCTECGRLKGDRFPLEGRRPQLVDPTREDPWQFIDFDPETGNLVARYDPVARDWSGKGEATVEMLQLDRREALSVGYMATCRRIRKVVNAALRSNASPDAQLLLEELRAADEHGLLGWFFSARGRLVEPMQTLASRHPDVWVLCRDTLG